MLEEVGVLNTGNIIFSTTPQEYYFDCPYQLSSQGSGQTYLDASVNIYVATLHASATYFLLLQAV
ncbi:hypothetical protein HID58_062560 [Brassica napus]|uniref:Uncharacterized protein n=1 Tax=Brassica napus TaxID=3708 RepID=A0ABQ8A1W5_BRANA|nr:hypothetical protein HID58_062560 [Brassica napus]